MKIESINSPSNPQINNAKAEVVQSARERAIAALMRPTTSEQAAAQQMPVSNPTQVAAEELSAIKASEASVGQIYSDEAPASDSVAEPKESSEPLSAQYAILARKEKALRQREQQLRAKEAAMQQAKPVEAPKAAEVDLSKFVDRDRLVKDPFSVLNELGLSYDQLTELAINAPKAEELAMRNEMKALREELKLIKSETEGTKKSFEETQKQQYEQAMNHIRNEASQLIKLDPQYETVRATNSISDVVELIERTFNEDGILLTVEEAAQQVESFLVDEAIRIAKLKKIQQKLAPPAKEAPKSTASPEKQQIKTLTNSVASSQKLSARERAILAMEGKLNKTG